MQLTSCSACQPIGYNSAACPARTHRCNRTWVQPIQWLSSRTPQPTQPTRCMRNACNPYGTVPPTGPSMHHPCTRTPGLPSPHLPLQPHLGPTDPTAQRTDPPTNPTDPLHDKCVQPPWYRSTNRAIDAPSLGLPTPAPANIMLHNFVWHDDSIIERLKSQLCQLAKRDRNEATAAHKVGLELAHATQQGPLSSPSVLTAMSKAEATLTRWGQIHLLYHQGADLLQNAAHALQAPQSLFLTTNPQPHQLTNPDLDPRARHALGQALSWSIQMHGWWRSLEAILANEALHKQTWELQQPTIVTSQPQPATGPLPVWDCGTCPAPNRTSRFTSLPLTMSTSHKAHSRADLGYSIHLSWRTTARSPHTSVLTWAVQPQQRHNPTTASPRSPLALTHGPTPQSCHGAYCPGHCAAT
jgi:hypothetical protein